MTLSLTIKFSACVNSEAINRPDLESPNTIDFCHFILVDGGSLTLDIKLRLIPVQTDGERDTLHCTALSIFALVRNIYSNYIFFNIKCFVFETKD